MGPLRFEARTALRQAGGGVRRLRFLLREREQRAEGKGRRRACSQIPKRTATSATFTSEQIGDRIEHFAIFSNHSLANNNGLPLLDSSPGAVDGGLPPSSLDEEINMALHQVDKNRAIVMFQEAAPQQLVKLLKTMRMRDPSAPAALWITGLSADLELPSHPHTAAHLAPKSRAKLLALAGLLGVPYTFSSFHGEHIVQDIYPRTEDVEKASVYGSKHPLPMHRLDVWRLCFPCAFVTWYMCKCGVGCGRRAQLRHTTSSNLVGGVFTNVSRFRINVLAFSLPLCRLPAVDLTEAIFGSLEMDWRFKDGSIPKRTVPILDRDTSSNSLRLSLFHPEFLPGARMYWYDESIGVHSP
eukprot:jgi/Bigna1/70078/fgenesh1_pg.10_\